MKLPTYSSLCVVIIACLCFSLACSSEEPTPDPDVIIPEEEDTVTIKNNFYKLIRIENFMTDTAAVDDNPTAPKSTAFFSLEAAVERPASYAKTNRWDIAFGGLYNSFLSANNGTSKDNHGYGANGVGGICILKENFNDVHDIPDASAFKITRDLFGTDDAGAFGAGTGWYLYDFGGTILGDGSYEKKHVAYALQDTRTLVVRTAKGNFAKIRMVSCYKDAFTPDKWFRDVPHMFFTFEYVMVPAGSTKFEIK